MSLINKDAMGILLQHEQEFYDIFDRERVRHNERYKGKFEYYHESNRQSIEDHYRAWERSRLNGESASLAFYAEEVDAIRLIDHIMTEKGIVNYE